MGYRPGIGFSNVRAFSGDESQILRNQKELIEKQLQTLQESLNKIEERLGDLEEKGWNIAVDVFPDSDELIVAWQDFYESIFITILHHDSIKWWGNMTKIGVTASGLNLDAMIDPRFGRCAYFIVVDSDTMEFDAIPNEAAMASGGAGVKAAQTMASRGVEVVITGSVGPNAYPALQNANIKILTGVSGTVRTVIDEFKQDTLAELTVPGPSRIGMRGQMGRGEQISAGGGRGGRGRGGGRRRWRWHVEFWFQPMSQKECQLPTILAEHSISLW
jgi:predicted Fe-Mo cluster-binding NifX family protein